MRKTAVFVALLSILVCGMAQAALVDFSTLTVGDTYMLMWDGSIDRTGTLLFNGSSKDVGMGVLNFAVSKNGTYLGDVQVVCIDLNIYLTSPFEYTLRKGYSSTTTPGMVGSEADWDALTHVVSNNSGAWNGNADERAGFALAAWELAAGDSVPAYQSDWQTTGNVQVVSVASGVTSAADAFLASSRPGMDWSGDLFWFDGVTGGQDLLTGVPEVPAWAVLQFGMIGLAWFGAKRRSRG